MIARTRRGAAPMATCSQGGAQRRTQLKGSSAGLRGVPHPCAAVCVSRWELLTLHRVGGRCYTKVPFAVLGFGAFLGRGKIATRVSPFPCSLADRALSPSRANRPAGVHLTLRGSGAW